MITTKPESPAILVYGEALFDTFPDGRRVLGGAPFNVAWNLHHLGTTARFVGAVGDDAPGREVIAAMQRTGLATDGVLTVDEPTGHVVVGFVDGEPVYEIPPGQAFDQAPGACLARVESSGLSSADWIYHGSLALRATADRDVFRVLGDAARCRFVDVNLRAPWYVVEGVRDLLRGADVVKVSAAELAELQGLDPASVSIPDAPEAVAAAQALAEALGIQQAVIVTFGAAGAMTWLAQGASVIRSAAPNVAGLALGDWNGEPSLGAVDAVGAGDAFSAALLHSIASGRPWREALAFAVTYAAGVTRLQGATSDDPAFYRALQIAATTAGQRAADA